MLGGGSDGVPKVGSLPRIPSDSEEESGDELCQPLKLPFASQQSRFSQKSLMAEEDEELQQQQDNTGNSQLMESVSENRPRERSDSGNFGGPRPLGENNRPIGGSRSDLRYFRLLRCQSSEFDLYLVLHIQENPAMRGLNSLPDVSSMIHLLI